MARLEHINPPSLHRSPAYSQAVAVPASSRIVFVGGQNAVGKDGSLVGAGDLAAQTLQALRNVEACVVAAGGRLQDVARFTVHLVPGVDPRVGFAAFQQVWGQASPPPAVTAFFVQALGRPEWLVEIEAVAAI